MDVPEGKYVLGLGEGYKFPVFIKGLRKKENSYERK